MEQKGEDDTSCDFISAWKLEMSLIVDSSEDTVNLGCIDWFACYNSLDDMFISECK